MITNMSLRRFRDVVLNLNISEVHSGTLIHSDKIISLVGDFPIAIK